jgi:hypothetical protein
MDLLSARSLSTVDVPFLAAFMSGITPSPSAYRASAPFPSSSLTASACPPTLAVIRSEIPTAGFWRRRR